MLHFRTAGVWLAIALFSVALFATTACERNQKLQQSDGDLDGDASDGDTIADGDVDGDADDDGDQEQPLVGMASSKWIMAQDSLLYTTDSGRVYMAAKAGLVGIEHGGTPADASDDSYLIHHELTLPDWPVADVTGLCQDGAGLVWVANKNGVFVIDDAGTFDDPSDDVGILPDLSDIVVSPREIVGLFCEGDGPGAWAVTTAGFVVMLPASDDTSVLESWTFVDYSGQSAALGVFPNAFDRDANGVFWVAAYAESTFALYAVETGAADDISDDTIHEIPYGFADPKPSFAAADAGVGLWLIHDKQAWHLNHNGSLSDSADDVWEALPIPADVSMNSIIALGENEALALEDGNREVYFVNPAPSAKSARYAGLRLDGDLDDELEIDGDVEVELEIDGDVEIEDEIDGDVEVELEIDGDMEIEDDIDGDVIDGDVVDGDVVDGDVVDGDAVVEVPSFTSVALPEFGVNADNPLTAAAYQPGIGLWYSSRYDVGVLIFAEGDLPYTPWTQQRFASLGAVPGNDLSGFVATEDGVWLGGPNGIVKVGYTAETAVTDFSFSGHPVSLPDSEAPFNIITMVPLDGGILAGGALPAWLSPEGEFTVWDGRNAPENVNIIMTTPSGELLISTLLRTIATIVGFVAYDYNGTPKNPADDDDQNLDNASFGFASGLPIQAMAHIDACRYLVGTIDDLSYWDCNDTPMDPSDDILHADLIRTQANSTITQNIRQVTVDPSGTGAWLITKDGLSYLDMAGTPEPDDDSLIAYAIPRIATSFDMDANGKLYYFMNDGFMIHDTKGTPTDLSDDEATILEMPTDSKAQVKLDAFGNIWYSYGDGSGIFFGRLGELTFSPIAELLGWEIAEDGDAETEAE